MYKLQMELKTKDRIRSSRRDKHSSSLAQPLTWQTMKRFFRCTYDLTLPSAWVGIGHPALRP